ncbi:MAG TPA: hypothetical protein VFU81_21245 [Thermomicrobiales bacterium]|nr:hypothetical protein [Thermomicrobiales bacterium]
MAHHPPDAAGPPERDSLGRWLAGLGAVVAAAALLGLAWIVYATIASPSPTPAPVVQAAASDEEPTPDAMVQALVAIATNTAPTLTPAP